MKVSDKEYIFDSLTQMAEILQKECNALCGIIDFEDDPETVAKKVGILENDADEINHAINYYYKDNNLNEDREAYSLFEILVTLEQCTDDIDELARDFVRYHVTEIKDNAVASLINTEAAASKLIEILFAMRKIDKAHSPFREILELDHFKVESSKHYDIHMMKLFMTEKDPIEVIKWKDIYMSIRRVFETYEDIAELCARYVLQMS